MPEDILSAHATFRDFATFMADFYPAINTAQTKTAFGDVAAFHLSYLCFLCPFVCYLRDFTAWLAALPVDSKETKATPKRFRKALFYLRLSYAFWYLADLMIFSGYWIWHTYRPTREFTMLIRFELFFYYELIGFSIANVCVMMSAYLIMQICRQLWAFVSLRACQTAAFFGRLFGRR